MIRLIGAELNRLTSRRLALVLTLAVIAVVALFQLAVVQSVTPPSAAEVAAARQGYEQDRQQWEQQHESWEQECRESPDTSDPATDCNIPAPTEQDYGLAPVAFADIAGVGVSVAVTVAMLAGYLLAASFIGAEYSTGSLGNWLTFVPRRERVYAAKIVALAVGSAILGAVAGMLMVGSAAIVTAAVGQPLTGIGGIVATAARGIPLVVFASLLGFCIAMLTRHTVAALGVLLGYGLVWIGMNIISFLVPTLSLLKRWQVETNVQAFLSYGHDYEVYQRAVTQEGVNIESVTRHLGFGDSAIYLSIVLVAFLVVTLVVFRRRDVT